ncbi:MAG: Ig-like domain-containing protein [Gemmatimonadaceae bacterium]|nr:Ig-like domain-containing protein [Gemmatimonadaceae bacterium]
MRSSVELSPGRVPSVHRAATAAQAAGALLRVLTAVAGVACADTVGPDDRPLVALRIVVEDSVLESGRAIYATAEGIDAAGGRRPIELPVWESSEYRVASVDGTGYVYAVDTGATDITARFNGLEARRVLRVVPRVARRLSTSTDTATIAQQGTVALQVTPRDISGDSLGGRVVTYLSENPAVARVSSTGVVTGVSQGNTRIVVTCEQATTAIRITVTDQVGGVERIAISPADDTLGLGQSVAFTASTFGVGDVPLSQRVISWQLSVVRGQDVASISPSGVVTARNPGIVILEALSEGRRASRVITVKEPLAPDIRLQFALPDTTSPVRDTIYVVLIANGPRPFVSASLTVDATIFPLRFEMIGANQNVPAWVGRLSLVGQRFGPLVLEGRVTDSDGKRGLATRSVLRVPGAPAGGTKPPSGSK